MKKYFLAILLCLSVICFAGTAISQNADYFYIKANSYLTSGRMKEAINYYNQSIKADQNFFEAYMGLSIAYRELGDYNKALESIQYAISLKPDYYQAYYNMGLILEKQNKPDDAVKAYEKFLKEVPGALKFSDVKQRILKLRG